MAVKTIQVARIQTRLEADGKQHTSAYQKAEREADHYVDHLKKKGKEAAKAFDGAGAGAKFGKDFGISAIASIGQSFNVSTLGSLIGTAVAPGIGTAVGGMIGSGIDKALSTVTPMVLNTIMSGVELNKVLEETRVEFKTLVGDEKEANKYLTELLDISKDIGQMPQRVIDVSETVSDLTNDLKLTRTILKAASEQAADFGKEGTFEKVAETLGLIAEKGELGSRELQKMFRLGVNAKKYLAEATGLQEKQIDQLIKSGRLRGDVAARLISEGILREKGGLAALKTSQTVAGRERQFSVLQQLRAAEGTAKMTEGYGDFLREANAILGSSQAKAFVEMIDKFSGQIIDWTKTGIKAGVSVGSGFAQGLMDGNSLSSMLGSFGRLKDWAGGALSSVFEIKSPSEWSAREVGEPLGEGIGVGLVRRFSGFMQGEGVDDLKRTLESLIADPKIQALLKTIETAEGGEVNIMAGGRRVNSGTKHPGEIVPRSQWFRGDRGPSSASGLFQITRTNWRKLAPMLGLTNFSDPRQQELAALALMAGRGGLPALQSGDIGQMMNLAAKDWTSTPGSTIGGGKQWNRSKWLNTYQSFLGNGGSITAANPMPVRVVTANGEFLDNLQAFTASNLANYKRGTDGAAMLDLIGGSSSELDTTAASIQDAGVAIVNITDATQDLITTTAQMVPTTALIMKTLPPALQAEWELAQARAQHASSAIAITKDYQEASKRALIESMGVMGKLQGMLGQVAGMIPGQQVGKKRGLLSKILGFAAPFLSFIPGVGPILSTIVGAAGNIAGGNYGAAVSSIAGGFASGGVFRSSPSTPKPNTLPGKAGRAHGGPVYKGQPYWVGGYGPRPEWELFTPKEDGHIYNQSQLRSRSAGGDDNWWKERLLAALERMESMRPDDVVRFGARGMLRAMDSDASMANRMGRRLNFGS